MTRSIYDRRGPATDLDEREPAADRERPTTAERAADDAAHEHAMYDRMAAERAAYVAPVDSDAARLRSEYAAQHVRAIHPLRAVCIATRDRIVASTGIAPHAVHAALAGAGSQASTIRTVDRAARALGYVAPQAALLDGRAA